MPNPDAAQKRIALGVTIAVAIVVWAIIEWRSAPPPPPPAQLPYTPLAPK
jgi:hypothetical protein